MKTFYKNHIVDLLLAILFLGLAIILLPFFSIGEAILDFVVAVALVAYIILFLAKRLTSARGTILALTVVEFIVIILIAIGLVLKNLQILPINQTCQIVGLVIWLRGAISLVKGYLISTPESRRKYSMLLFMGFIALVTLGTWLMVKPPFTDEVLITILCVIAFLIFACMLALCIKFWPKSKKNKAPKQKKVKGAKSAANTEAKAESKKENQTDK